MNKVEAQHLIASGWNGDIKHLPTASYDIGILFLGWEMRSTSISSAVSLKFEEILAVKWVEAAGDLRERSFAEVKKYAYRFRLSTLECCMYDMRGTLDNLLLQVEKTVIRKRRAISVFIDISSAPEYFAMALLARLTSERWVTKISFYYSEVEYDSTQGISEFTLKEWKTLPIPRIFSPEDKTLPTTLVVGLGFEGGKTQALVDYYESEYLFGLLPFPGFSSKYSKRAICENFPLIKIIKRMGKKRRLYAPAGDIVAAYKALAESEIENEVTNIRLIPTGPKTHAIAMALYGLTHENCTVLYRNPEIFQKKNNLPNGKCWLCDVYDTSVITDPPSPELLSLIDTAC